MQTRTTSSANEKTPPIPVSPNREKPQAAAANSETAPVQPSHSSYPRRPDRDDVFFDCLMDGMTVSESCARAGYAKASLYRWLAADSDFKNRWAFSRQHAAQLLEEEADRRARIGWDEAVFYKGRMVGTRRKFSDRMLIARLKATNPGLYRGV